jgi:hypothetical protein
LTRRPGTAYLKEVKFSDKKTRLFRFEYSITQVYKLEFGAGYIRFITNDGILTASAQTITAISKASTAVLTYSGSDTYANDDRVYISGVVGMTQVNNREFIVKSVDTGANTFQLYERVGGADVAVNSTGYDTFTSGTTSLAEIYQVATSFVENDLVDIRVVQSADVLYILHPDFAPQQLVRVSALSWTLSTISFTDGPYDVTNATATTLSPSAATGTVTVTASAITGINDDVGFAATDIGRLIRLDEGGVWGYGSIVGFASVTVVTVSVLSTLTNTNAKVNWRLGVWSGTTGYPRTGTFAEDRLFLGGAAVYPQRLDGSRTGRYSNFSPSATNGTVADDNAISFTLNSDDVNVIRWMANNDRGLVVGTGRNEWLVRPSTLSEALTPTNISAKMFSNWGSAEVEPVRAGRAILFIQRAARKLRELVYVFEVDGLKSPDMTLLAEHVTAPSVTRMAMQNEPQEINWAVRSDGTLLGLTYMRDQDVVGWHRHELGGQSDSNGLLIPVVEDVIVTPTTDGTRDEATMIVKRYVNGATKRYIEVMTKFWDHADDQEDAVHLDASWTVINSPASAAVTGLWHLEGETVSVYADGAALPDVTVTNGKVTISTASSIVTLGYPYTSDAVLMPIEGGAQDGTAQGKTKIIKRFGLWLLDTLGIKIGPDSDHLTELIFKNWGNLFGSPPSLFTGIRRERFEGGYDRLGQATIRCDGPFPATVLAVMPQVETSDDS